MNTGLAEDKGKRKTEHQQKSMDKIWTKIPSQKINKLGGIKMLDVSDGHIALVKMFKC
jgi:hypothetical protein